MAKKTHAKSFWKLLPAKEAKKFIIIFYCVGFAGFIIPITRPVFEKIIPLALLVNIVLLFYFNENRNFRVFFLSLFIFTTGFAIEVIGVNTGFPFGQYSYGNALGIKVANTPLIIGLNWLMLIYAGTVFMHQFKLKRSIKIVVVAVLLLLYDFLLEPVAVRFDMWHWNTGNVPLSNYISWFVIAIFLTAVLFVERKKIINPLASYILSGQFIFFILLNLYFVFTS